LGKQQTCFCNSRSCRSFSCMCSSSSCNCFICWALSASVTLLFPFPAHQISFNFNQTPKGYNSHVMLIERKFRNWDRVWANFIMLKGGVQSKLKEDPLLSITLLKEYNSINVKIPVEIKQSRVLSFGQFMSSLIKITIHCTLIYQTGSKSRRTTSVLLPDQTIRQI